MKVLNPQYYTPGKDGKTLTIQFPEGIAIGGETVKAVEMREPMLRDRLAAKKATNPDDVEPLYAASLIGAGLDDILELSARQYDRILVGLDFFQD